MGKPKYKQTVTRLLKDDARKFFAHYDNNKTRSRYVNNYFKFIEFCRSEYSCKTKEECAAHIQDYEASIESQVITVLSINTEVTKIGEKDD